MFVIRKRFYVHPVFWRQHHWNEDETLKISLFFGAKNMYFGDSHFWSESRFFENFFFWIENWTLREMLLHKNIVHFAETSSRKKCRPCQNLSPGSKFIHYWNCQFIHARKYLTSKIQYLISVFPYMFLRLSEKTVFICLNSVK